jgi:hypothetical protein
VRPAAARHDRASRARRSGGAQPCRQSTRPGPPGPAKLMQDLHRSRGRGDDPTGTKVHRRPVPPAPTTVPDTNRQHEQVRPVSGCCRAVAAVRWVVADPGNFFDLPPARVAVVLVDFQNDFCSPVVAGGGPVRSTMTTSASVGRGRAPGGCRQDRVRCASSPRPIDSSESCPPATPAPASPWDPPPRQSDPCRSCPATGPAHPALHVTTKSGGQVEDRSG